MVLEWGQSASCATHFSKPVLKRIDGIIASRAVPVITNRGIRNILRFRK
jgi:hypothetical protein